jgi:epoxyqueuosine reductase QueG
MRKNLSKALKEKAIELGASVVGIADAGRFDEAPEGHKPTDILDDATSITSIGVAQPRAVIQRSMPTQYTRNIFTTAGICDGIASRMSIWIEGHGFEAIPISARFLYMDGLTGVFRGDLSHKHTAMLAGLGEIGIHSLLINPTYGTRLKLVSVVTKAPVRPGSPFTESLCPRSECLKCVTACPVKAISSSGEIDKEKCAKYYRRYPDIYFETWGLYFCRECRRVCPVPQ